VLQTAASVASAKISAVLSPQAQTQMITPLSLPGPPQNFPRNAIALNAFRAAIRGRLRLEFRYEDERQRRTERVVWPIQLGFMDQARVLFAWCELRQDFRTFRTDRIAAMTQLERYPAQRPDLVHRLRTHLDKQAKLKITPDGN
jgi:predicted DNA-binding transcriptional regulator YafY